MSPDTITALQLALSNAVLSDLVDTSQISVEQSLEAQLKLASLEPNQIIALGEAY